jgi:hypothetical protein
MRQRGKLGHCDPPIDWSLTVLGPFGDGSVSQNRVVVKSRSSRVTARAARSGAQASSLGIDQGEGRLTE